MYRVLLGVSTRKSPDQNNPLYEKFFEWRPGDRVEEFPAWVEVDALKKSGHIEVIVEEKKPEPPAPVKKGD